jgi:membrane dipeptidase
VHYRVNEIGDVQTEELVHGGLTAFGRQVVAECNHLGVIVDCAHATFETTVGVLEVSSQPIMVSHSHLGRAERHHPRLLSAGHAQEVAEAGGLIGAWPSGVTSTSLDDFADEVTRLADLVGVDHVGIGTEMDRRRRGAPDRRAGTAPRPARGRSTGHRSRSRAAPADRVRHRDRVRRGVA